MALYARKSTVVEAEQFWPDRAPLPFSAKGPYVALDEVGWYVVTAHAQSVYLAPGDWIVLEPVGPGVPSFAAYPIKPDIFEATYERAEPTKEGEPKP